MIGFLQKGKFMRVALVFGAMVLLSSCASRPTVQPIYKADHDFSGYKTFSWIDEQQLSTESLPQVSKLTLDALKEAVRDDLRSKGFAEVENTETADFGVNVSVNFDQTFDVSSTDRSVYVPSDASADIVNRAGARRDSVVVARSGYSDVSLNPIIDLIDVGELTIEIFDTASDDKVWAISGAREISYTKLDGGNAEQVIDVFLDGFPPKAD